MLSACLLLTLSNQLPPQGEVQITHVLKPIKVNLISLMAPKPKPIPKTNVKPPQADIPLKAPAQFQPAVVTKKTAPKQVKPSYKKAEAEVVPKTQATAPKAPAPKPVIKQKINKTELVKKLEAKIAMVKPLTLNKQASIVASQPTQKSSTTKNVKGNAAATVIQNATYRRQSPPSYPRRALDLGQQGTVMIHARVSLIGLPEDLKIAKSSGHKLLDLSALSAVKKWEFEPVNIDGEPTIGWVRVPVNFVIQ